MVFDKAYVAANFAGNYADSDVDSAQCMNSMGRDVVFVVCTRSGSVCVVDVVGNAFVASGGGRRPSLIN
jgi:hypothetical protein